MAHLPHHGPAGRVVTRRKFLAGLVLAGLGVPFDARFLEPRWLEISQVHLRSGESETRPPFKVLHLSDLHASPEVGLPFIEKAIQRGLALTPDLVCITGDLITRKFDQLDRYARILAEVAQRVPAFACLGNHDGGSWAAAVGGYEDTEPVRRLLAQGRVGLLHNSALSLRVRDRNLCLVGLGDLWAREFEPQRAFAGVKPATDTLTIVLSHNPDTKEALAAHPWQILLSGHTHGGQLRLPFVGTPFAPVEDKRYVRGAHRWRGRWLHITKGVGNVYGLRLNCRPEISLLSLT